MCDLFQPLGLAAVLGPLSDVTSPIVKSITKTYHVPHLDTRWDYSQDRHPFSVNIHPHPAVLGKVCNISIFSWLIKFQLENRFE